jgi:putative membrane protein insertion efficiency factor
VTRAAALLRRDGERTGAPNLIVRSLAAAVGAYKRFVSPLLPPACRFMPTCSEYAREALLRHGLLRGCALAVKRLARCHPFHRGGHDPVP